MVSVDIGNVGSGVAPRTSTPHVMLWFGAATQLLGFGLGAAGGLVVNETGTLVLLVHAGTVTVVVHSGSQQPRIKVEFEEVPVPPPLMAGSVDVSRN